MRLSREGFKNISKWWKNEAGDTLIEVVMALAILSMVLTSSTVLAADAFRMGQTARERMTLADEAQGQMEAVRAFRDSNTWSHFLNGDPTGGTVTNPNPGNGTDYDRSHDPYTGILNTPQSQGCHVTSPCWHMEPHTGTTFLPSDSWMSGSVPTSYIELVAQPEAGASPNRVDVTVNYGFDTTRGEAYAGHIKTTFTNLQLAVPGPVPPVTTTCTPVKSDIAFVSDESGSMMKQWGGASRMDQLKIVEKSFIDSVGIGLTANHASVIGFDETARIYTPLTASTTLLKAGVDQLTDARNLGTHYVEGLKAADTALSDPVTSRTGVNKVVIFVSDGQALDYPGDPNATNQAVMNEMNNLPAGTIVYTIGINLDGEDMTLLTNMPMNGGFYSDAKSPAQLQQISDSIVDQLSCSAAAPVAAMPTPTPAPTPTPTATSTPSPTPDGGAAIGTTDCTPLPECLNGQMVGGSYQFYDGIYNRSPLGQQVTGCVWDWGDGTKTVNESCNPGDIEWHQWPTLTNLAPYPQDCPPIRGDGVVDYKVVLTLYLANGLAPQSNTYLEPSPVCY